MYVWGFAWNPDWLHKGPVVGWGGEGPDPAYGCRGYTFPKSVSGKTYSERVLWYVNDTLIMLLKNTEENQKNYLERLELSNVQNQQLHSLHVGQAILISIYFYYRIFIKHCDLTRSELQWKISGAVCLYVSQK